MEYLKIIGIIVYLVIGSQFGKYFYKISHDVLEERIQDQKDLETDEMLSRIISTLAGLLWPIPCIVGIIKTFMK